LLMLTILFMRNGIVGLFHKRVASRKGSEE